MAIRRHFTYSRAAVRLMAAAGLAALASGCSDASRFAGDPFADPFAGSTKVASRGVDRAPTGAILPPAEKSAASTPVESRPLPAPTASAPAPRPVAQASAPTGSLGPARWSAEGGTPIVVSQGETAAVLATRYGVPADALLRTNGFTTAAQIKPGARVVIPVYRAGGPAVAEAKPAPAPVAAKTAAVPAKPEKGKLGAAKAAPEKIALEKAAPPRSAEATQPRPVKAERIVRAEAPVEPAPKAAEKPETTASRKVDSTATASIPPAAAEAKAVAADDGRPEFRWPARGRIIQGFTTGGNDGINIAVPEGTQVKAAEGGVVAYAGSELKGYGNLVLIRHPNGFVSAYAHNGALDVKRGDQVKRGQTIARSGQSGNVGSPQLHFELRKGSTPVDPTQYLAGL